MIYKNIAIALLLSVNLSNLAAVAQSDMTAAFSEQIDQLSSSSCDAEKQSILLTQSQQRFIQELAASLKITIPKGMLCGATGFLIGKFFQSIQFLPVVEQKISLAKLLVVWTTCLAAGVYLPEVIYQFRTKILRQGDEVWPPRAIGDRELIAIINSWAGYTSAFVVSHFLDQLI